jgi:hypothetical protein
MRRRLLGGVVGRLGTPGPGAPAPRLAEYSRQRCELLDDGARSSAETTMPPRSISLRRPRHGRHIGCAFVRRSPVTASACTCPDRGRERPDVESHLNSTAMTSATAVSSPVRDVRDVHPAIDEQFRRQVGRQPGPWSWNIWAAFRQPDQLLYRMHGQELAATRNGDGNARPARNPSPGHTKDACADIEARLVTVRRV